MKRPIFYPAVVALVSAAAFSLFGGLVLQAVAGQTPALLLVLATGWASVVVRAARVSWRLVDGELRVCGIFVNRRIPANTVESISMRRSFLPVGVLCWAADTPGGHRRLPSTMRLQDSSFRQEGERLRVALSLPKDCVL